MISRNIGWCAFYRKKSLFSIVLFSFILLEFALLIPVSSTPVAEWSKTFGEADYDESAFSVVQTEDGGYIIAGKQLAGPRIGIEEQALLIKTDANGNQAWIRTFGENGGRGASSVPVQQTQDKGYIFAGDTTSSERGDIDIRLLKTDENGNSMWTKTFGGKNDDRAVSVQLTKDGGYLLTGYTTQERVKPELYYETGDLDIILIKTDENGNQQWNRTFGGKKNEIPSSAIQTKDGGFIIAAWTESYGNNNINGWMVYGKNNNINGWMVKTDVNGLEQWNRVFDENMPTSVQQTKDNGYIIAGYSMFDFRIMRLNFYDFNDAWLIKTDGNGDTEWKKTFGGYQPLSVQQTMDSGYIVAGNSYPRYLTWQYRWDANAWVLKTDAKGDELWSMLLGGKNYVASSVLQTEEAVI